MCVCVFLLFYLCENHFTFLLWHSEGPFQPVSSTVWIRGKGAQCCLKQTIHLPHPTTSEGKSVCTSSRWQRADHHSIILAVLCCFPDLSLAAFRIVLAWWIIHTQNNGARFQTMGLFFFSPEQTFGLVVAGKAQVFLITPATALFHSSVKSEDVTAVCLWAGTNNSCTLTLKHWSMLLLFFTIDYICPFQAVTCLSAFWRRASRLFLTVFTPNGRLIFEE